MTLPLIRQLHCRFTRGPFHLFYRRSKRVCPTTPRQICTVLAALGTRWRPSSESETKTPEPHQNARMSSLSDQTFFLCCRSPTRKLNTGAERAFQLILPKQYSQDLGIIVLRLLGENVSHTCFHTCIQTLPRLTSCRLTASPTTVCNKPACSSCRRIMDAGRLICF